MPRHDTVLKPLVDLLPRWIRPNHLVWARVILTVPIGFAILQGRWIIAPSLFILASALDVLDGSLARLRQQVTPAGEMLDPIADKLLFGVTFALLGFTLLPANLFLTVLMVEFVTFLGAATTASIWYRIHHEEPRVSANRYGKYKTALYFVATLLLFFSPFSLILYRVSVTLYYLGLLAAIISMVAYNLNLAKKA